MSTAAADASKWHPATTAPATSGVLNTNSNTNAATTATYTTAS